MDSSPSGLSQCSEGPLEGCPSKPKSKPTVTPRSFKRFFTPRHLLHASKRRVSLRSPLVDITRSGTNRGQLHAQAHSTKQASAHVFDEDENPILGSNNLSDRKRGCLSPDGSLQLFDRSKRSKILTVELQCPQDRLSTDQDSDAEDWSRDPTSLPKNIVKSRYRTKLGLLARRESGIPSDDSRKPFFDYCSDWRSEVVHFYTGIQDVHTNSNVTADSPELALPFCTAACNTNTLIAVGDDDGAVRLLESEKGGKPAFAQSYLNFQPHTNAILDLAFSLDDSMLATASGDQTGNIIDMLTQTTIYKLRGHRSSVKQVRFQPGSSNNVIATSSRDGSIQIWDLRCRGPELCAEETKVDLESNTMQRKGAKQSQTRPKFAACVNAIFEAHISKFGLPDSKTIGLRQSNSGCTTASQKSRSRRRNEISITALSFLSASSPHLLLSASEASATVKLWDLRMKQISKDRVATPLSTTCQPDAHGRHRQFGLTSLSVGSDCSRLYALCKDSSVYVYSIPHLILGSAPNVIQSDRARRGGEEKQGLGPLFALRHPKLKASTFYIKSSLRPTSLDQSEILAVGSTDSCAILFPTNEKYLRKQWSESQASQSEDLFASRCTSPSSDLSLRRSSQGGVLEQQGSDNIPSYEHGLALVNGHDKEVTGLTWNTRGELITVSDDMTCRVWREDAAKAASLRTEPANTGNRWGHGWADLSDQFDDWDADE